MADKLRTTQPLAITFAAGEQPSAAKLSAITAQSRAGGRILERAVGDLWNQSGDASLTNFPLQIANLARTVGESKWGPAMHLIGGVEGDSFLFTENINYGNKAVQKNRGFLKFAPEIDIEAVDVSGAQAAYFTTKKASRDLVQSTLEYFVDLTTGEWFTFETIQPGDEVIISYQVKPGDWSKSIRTVPNVIPEIRQDEFTACRLSDETSHYRLYLPPRRPLNFGTLDGDSRPGSYPTSEQAADVLNSAGLIDATPHTSFWQTYVDTTTPAVAHGFYRYALSFEAYITLFSLSVGDRFPQGLFLLWDLEANTVVDDAIFYKDDLAGNYTLRVTSVTADSIMSTRSTADETEASYNAGLYAIIIPGSPLTRRVADNERRLETHTHAPNNEFSQPISHSNAVDHTPSDEADIGVAWPHSGRDHDHHTNLLDRLGSRGAAQRDVFKGAMLGPLIMGNADVATHDYINAALPDDSFEILFGDVTGPYIKGVAGGVDVNGEVIATDLQTIGEADIDTISATPIALVAAPGAGFAFVITGAYLKVVGTGGTAADFAANTDVRITAGTGGQVLFEAVDIESALNATAEQLIILSPATQTSFVLSNFENLGLFVETNQNPATAAGDEDWDITLHYRIIAV